MYSGLYHFLEFFLSWSLGKMIPQFDLRLRRTCFSLGHAMAFLTLLWNHHEFTRWSENLLLLGPIIELRQVDLHIPRICPHLDQTLPLGSRECCTSVQFGKLKFGNQKWRIFLFNSVIFRFHVNLQWCTWIILTMLCWVLDFQTICYL